MKLQFSTLGDREPNQYFLYINKQLISWDIYETDSGNRGFVGYFRKVMQAVEENLQKGGFTFYITMTEMDELPTYGDNVIVLILGDEFYRIPKYHNKVGAIFKCYGIHQIRQEVFKYRPILKISRYKILVFGQSLKNLLIRLPLKLNYWLRKVKRLCFTTEDLAPIYDIPPGYFNSEDLPIKNVYSRRYDVFFDGSVVNHVYPVWSLRYWSKTPKAVSREQMVSNLEQFKAKYPQYNIQLACNAFFADASSEVGSNSYAQNMMDTKVCLVPRGTTLETYRFFEAMRYGCIIITELLPPRWFYDGAPVIQIANWNNLELVLQKLLNDEELMQILHQQTLEWWENRCSETAIGKYIAERLNGILVKRHFGQLQPPKQGSPDKVA
ncbi:glycosyltransferase family 1 protein [Egbenema bharatensis]|uniref:glycosyltransferase family 1 protein n=1 Tax=Egbenema bharatensis TaxID=3463334 RepID=UPI003A86F7C4